MINRPLDFRASHWQGDSLSPYLFVLCAEGLSFSLRDMQAKGLIHKCSIARNAPSISHLFFVNDNYFFFKSSQVNVDTSRTASEIMREPRVGE